MKNTKISFLELLYILLFTTICLSPFLNVYITQVQILGLEIAYTMFVYFKDSELGKFALRCLLCAFIISVLYVTTTELITISNVANRTLKGIFSFTYQYNTLIFPVLFFKRMQGLATKVQKMIVLAFSLVLLMVVVFNTLEALQYDPGLMKSQMASNIIDDDAPAIGGYFYVIAGPVWVTSLFYGFRNSPNKILKYLMLALCIFFLYYVASSGYTIAFLACLIGCVLCIYIENEHRNPMVWVIIGLLIIFLMPFILSAIIALLPDDAPTVERMKELLMVSQTGNKEGTDLLLREELYIKGLLAFIKSPIWGNYSLSFNPHSTFIEILASLGLLGGITLYKELKMAKNKIKEALPREHLIPFIAVYVFQACTNPINSSISIAISIWFLTPLLLDVLNQQRHNNEIM